MNGFIYIFSASTLHMKSDKSITDTSCHKMNTSTIQKLVHVNEQYFFICFFLFFPPFFFIGFVSCSFCLFHLHFLQATVNYMQYILTMHHYHHSFNQSNRCHLILLVYTMQKPEKMKLQLYIKVMEVFQF